MFNSIFRPFRLEFGVRLLVVLFILFLSFGSNNSAAAATTVTKTYPGPSVMVDAKTDLALPPVTFVAGTDFPTGYVVRKVTVSITWEKFNTSPSGLAFFEEVGMKIRGPAGTSVALIIPSTLASHTPNSYGFEPSGARTPGAMGIITTVFDDAAAGPHAGGLPVAGTFQAEQGPGTLGAAFQSSSPFGDWTLLATDTASQDPLRIDSYSVTVTADVPAADLRISKTDAPDPVLSGENITYTVTIVNLGPDPAQNVRLDDTVPAGTTFQSLTAPLGWTQVALPPVGGTGAITYTRAALSVSDGPQVFMLVVQVAPTAANGSTIANTATVSTTTADPVPGNNSAATATTVIAASDVRITKTGAPNPASEGKDITYTLTIVNAGPADALNVRLDDVLPLSTTFQSVIAPAGWSQVALPPVGATGTITYTRPTLTVADGPQVFLVVVKVNFGAAAASPTSNTATVTTSTFDPDLSNNTATENTTLQGVGGGLKVRQARYSIDFGRRRRLNDPAPDGFSFRGEVSLADLVADGVDLNNLDTVAVQASLGGVTVGLSLPYRANRRQVVWRTVGGFRPFMRMTFNQVTGAYNVQVRGVDLDTVLGLPNGKGVNVVVPIIVGLTVGPWNDSALLDTVYSERKANTIARGRFDFGRLPFDLPEGIFFLERTRLLQRTAGGVVRQRVIVSACFLPPDGVAFDPSGGVGVELSLGAFSEDVGGATAPDSFMANTAHDLFTYRRPLFAGRTGVARMSVNLRRWKMTAITHWMPANAVSPFGVAPVLHPLFDSRHSLVFPVEMQLNATYSASALLGRNGVHFVSGVRNAAP